MSNARNLARLLPDSSGKIQLPSQVAGVLPDANAPSGSVLQVVQAVKSDTQSTTDYSMVDVTGLSVNITPINPNSKFLVSWRVILSADYYMSYMNVVRNTTPIFRGDSASSRPTWTSAISFTASESNAHGFTHHHTGTYLDAPNSSSPLTYKIQFSGRYGGEGLSGVTFINRTVPDRDMSTYDARYASNIIVMEIAP